ncbi:MAG: RES domain-containing protein [Solirubrobacterales bacterium]|nr:RES domain-containing protein [Solirubrobacterales bacterium]
MGRRRPSLTSWEGTAYRATTYDVPLWVRPNRRPGRWNFARELSAQYLCLDVDAPFAELIRNEQLRTERDAAMLRVSLWEVRLFESAIADYGTFEKAEAAGFPAKALVDDDRERCQHEARWLIECGARGVLAPSAALPGTVNLTLFGPRVEVPWQSETKLSSEVRVRRIGGKGPPPTGLVDRVRHYGDPHAGLEAHRQAVRARRSAG